VPKLTFKKQPAKYFQKTSSETKKRLTNCFDKMTANNLAALDIKPLKGEYQGLMRVRIGDLRIFYRFMDKDNIDILLISSRGDAY